MQLHLQAGHPHSGQRGTAEEQARVNPSGSAFPGVPPSDNVQPFARTEARGRPGAERAWEKQASIQKEMGRLGTKKETGSVHHGGGASMDPTEAAPGASGLPLLRLPKRPLVTQPSKHLGLTLFWKIGHGEERQGRIFPPAMWLGLPRAQGTQRPLNLYNKTFPNKSVEAAVLRETIKSLSPSS